MKEIFILTFCTMLNYDRAFGCGPYEEYVHCKNCERTCQNDGVCVINDTTNDISDCHPGCQCQNGFVRMNPPLFYCWPISICQELQEVDKRCGPNQEFLSNRGCIRTCQTISSSMQCPSMPGCNCMAGYVMDDGGSCLPAASCGEVRSELDVDSKDSTCSVNEEWTDCVSTNCRPSCFNPRPHSCSSKCYKGCTCKEGYFREGTFDDNFGGACVPAGKCRVKGACHQKVLSAIAQHDSPEESLLKCRDDGRFAVLQCHESHCWCVGEDTGLELSGTRRGPGQRAPNCQAFHETDEGASSPQCPPNSEPVYCDKLAAGLRPQDFCHWISAGASLRNICSDTCCGIE